MNSLKGHLFYSLGMYTYCTGIGLLGFSQFYLSDANSANTVPNSYNAITDLNKLDSENNINYNLNAISFKTTSLYIIATGLLIMNVVILVQYPLISTTERAISIIPFSIMIIATLYNIFLIDENKDRISNNNVVKKYYVVQTAIVLFHVFYAVSSRSIESYIDFMGFTFLIGIILCGLDFGLFIIFTYFITDG